MYENIGHGEAYRKNTTTFRIDIEIHIQGMVNDGNS